MIRGWKDELVRVHQRVEDLFPRSEVRKRSLSYLEGLLGRWRAQERLAGGRVCWRHIALRDAVFAGPGALGGR